MNKKIALFSLALALAPSVRADKQASPPPATPKGFSVPQPKTFTLDNGLAVTLVPYGTVPKVTVRLAVLTGNVDEAANQVWLADLVGDMLSEGTATRTASQIAEDAARMGGSLDVNVGENRTEIGGDVLSEFGPEMVALVADVARHPKFPGVRARAPEGRPGAPALDREEPAAAARPGEVPRRALRRPPLRPPLPDRGDALGLHDRAGARLLREELRRRALAPLRRRASSTPPPWRPRSARPSATGSAATRPRVPAGPPRAHAPSTSSTARAPSSRRSIWACPSSTRRSRTGTRSS